MLEIKDITRNKDLVLESFKGIQNIKTIRLPIIVVYDRPKDYPEQFVARLFDFSKPTNMITLKDSLEEIRKTIPKTMVWFGKDMKDDEKIVECYM